MNKSCDNLVILGLGLMGGSLARAVRASGFCGRVIGCGHREPSLRRGLELGIIDEFTLDLDEAAARADILAVCTPTLAAAEVLERLLPDWPADGPVLTDVASVKGSLRDTAVRVAGAVPPRLVLAHPIAGSERSGVEASTAELFVGHRVIMTPVPGNDPRALELVRQMWESTGAEVVEMSVDAHDAILAATSHLPHMLAYTLVDALAASGDSDEMFRCAAGGFRDFTRIAASDPVMWRDIALANRDALLEAIDVFSDHLGRLRAAVAAGDGDTLHSSFTRAKRARDEFAQLLAARGGGD
ncbi:MAG: prephenate dehydrogenase/arogenate dehydrogenase family protein [Halioglobus sp.]|nr:prephenate dehydrogenase/arogenate dehydrogenase family protein [Halioglobus sp.]